MTWREKERDGIGKGPRAGSAWSAMTLYDTIWRNTVPCANRYLSLINKLQTHLLSIIQSLWQTSSIPFPLYVHQSFWWGATDGVGGAEASMFLLSSIHPLFLTILSLSVFRPRSHFHHISFSNAPICSSFAFSFSLNRLFISTMMVNHKTCICQWIQLKCLFVTRVLLNLWNVIFY